MSIDELARELYNAKKSKLTINWTKWEYVPEDEKDSWRAVASRAANIFLFPTIVK